MPAKLKIFQPKKNPLLIGENNTLNYSIKNWKKIDADLKYHCSNLPLIAGKHTIDSSCVLLQTATSKNSKENVTLSKNVHYCTNFSASLLKVHHIDTAGIVVSAIHCLIRR